MRGLLEWMNEKGFYTKTVWDLESAKWTGAGKMQLFPHQLDILGHCFTPDENGDYPYTTIVYSAPKKSGKTQIAALIGAWAGECAPPDSEIYSIANDLEQAMARTFTDIIYHVEQNLGLSATRYRLDYENGTFIQAIANQYSSAAGARQFMTLWDELWGYSCLEAGTLVLTAELRWKPIEDLVAGEELVAFDEDRGEAAYRSFRKSTVTEVARCRSIALRLRLANGEELTCSRDHKLLVRAGKHHTNVWKYASELKAGDYLNRVSEVWADSKSYNSGYLSGAFDGEGSLTQNGREGWRLDFAQRENAMRTQVKTFLDDFGFHWWDSNKVSSTCKNLGMANKHQVMKFLGMIRPPRLLSKLNIDNLGRMTSMELSEIVSIEETEPGWPLVSVSTTTGTLIAGGYAVHNSERSRRMWAEMTPPPTVPNAMRIVVTYAGFENESQQLLDLYQMCFKKENGQYVAGEDIPELAHLTDVHGNQVCRKNGRVFIYWDTEPRMPWQSQEYYLEQVATLRPSDFLRMHRNRWASSMESFIPMELWDLAVKALPGPLTIDKGSAFRSFPISIGVDIGMKHDCSALVGVYYDQRRRKVGLAFHHIWTPPKDGGMLDLEFTVEMELLRLWHEYRIVSVGYDPSQFQRSALTLSRAGMPLVEFTQTAGNMTLATQVLYDLLKTHSLEAYPDEELRDHLRYASAETTARGFRLVKGKHTKFAIDAAIALAMACYDAVNRGGVDTTVPIRIISPFADASAVRIPNVQDLYQMKLPAALRD